MIRLRFGKVFASLLCAFCLVISFSPQTSASLTPLNDDTEFIKHVYRDFLNREPNSEELNNQVSQIAAGTFDRTALVSRFLDSDEFQQNIAPVVRLYFTYFLRIPDYGGLTFWIDHYNQGMSLGTISDEFVKSPEFNSMYGKLSNQEYVNQMYLNIYEREPDLDGLDFWSAHLVAGRLTRGQVMVEFSSAQEYLAKSANQVYVTMNFMGLIQRAPDQAEFVSWIAVMDQGGSGLALIDKILFSNEYTDRFSAGTIDFDDDGDGYTDSQGDCNDKNSSISPIATEICGDGIDQDCSGSDEGCAPITDYDGDGYSVSQGDCNDANGSINPIATEICGDGIDQNCNDSIDEGCVTVPSYTDNGNGTVTDNTTGLVWQQVYDRSKLNWYEATEYCANLTLGGSNDWRLPERNELVEASYPNSGLDLHSFSNFFGNKNNYWSSTPVAIEGYTDVVWCVDFGYGHDYIEHPWNEVRPRCVR